MIVYPVNKEQWNVMAEFLRVRAGVAPSADLRMIAWVSEGELAIVAGFNSWIGSLCQVHIANRPGFRFCPRSMLMELFHYAFDVAQRKMLLATLNSKNKRAVKMDTQLGFKEILRVPGMHEDGGDFVLMGLTREAFRYKERRDEQIAA